MIGPTYSHAMIAALITITVSAPAIAGITAQERHLIPRKKM
jgi:hypothetical protein